jgi:hypothetical protein
VSVVIESSSRRYRAVLSETDRDGILVRIYDRGLSCRRGVGKEILAKYLEPADMSAARTAVYNFLLTLPDGANRLPEESVK